MTAQTQTYNGWTNYETWNVALWLGNDEGTYNLVREMAQEARESDRATTGYMGATPALVLADALEDMVKTMAPDLGASMFADLLGAALSDVRWYEIAENILSED